MTAVDRRVAMAFLAHPDDAEFLCAGTLAHLADAGWEVHITTATPGDCKQSQECHAMPLHRRSGERAGCARQCVTTQQGQRKRHGPTPLHSLANRGLPWCAENGRAALARATFCAAEAWS